MTERLALIDTEIMRCKALIREHMLRSGVGNIVSKKAWFERLESVQTHLKEIKPSGFVSLLYSQVESFLNRNIVHMFTLDTKNDADRLQIGSIMKNCRDFIKTVTHLYPTRTETSLSHLFTALSNALDFTDDVWDKLATTEETNVFLETILEKAGVAILNLETKSVGYYDKSIGPGATIQMRLIGKALQGE